MSEFIRMYGPVLVTVVQLLLAWFIWSMRREFTTTKKCEDHRKDMAGECSRSRAKLTTDLNTPADKTAGDLEELKRRVERLPDRSEMREFSREMGEMNKTLGKLEGRLFGIGQAVDLMNQHLINEGHDK